MHTLITIPFSHYNEKARWALERWRVPYRELRFVPVLHAPAVLLATRGGRDGRADKVSSRLSTPVLVTDTGERITDSAAILAWVDQRHGTAADTLYPTPEVAALEAELGLELGPHARRVAYGFGLERPDAFLAIVRANVGRLQAAVARVLAPWLVRGVVRGLRVDAARVEASRARVLACFDTIGARLTERGTGYLCGDRFTAADLTFACLSAPVLLPSRDEGFGATLPSLQPEASHAAAPAAAALAHTLRDTVAGRHALRMFARHRGPLPGAA
ncbi:MAG: glutathione S-transferase family protein [Nannocystaceae bacterium]|nr:glutathione S-transferase family protein [Nannocystaceae bacterium]